MSLVIAVLMLVHSATSLEALIIIMMGIRKIHALPLIGVFAREKVSNMQFCLCFLNVGPDF